jgi:hypothetical protein
MRRKVVAPDEKFGDHYFLFGIPCNPLKSHKTAKAFFGKAWGWNHENLEKLGQ